ncbi:MAG: hypothetical protein COV57_02325 [Candidatus Liptonbacteria bacterium CG11_big_fil_rev_8_21_14_0_20_35_14]|uniref:Uncharacterized protein n=1 Tax=Candidatus Liptonbacteria bacterium CG11_big_fil_rev_8_21_14_0_20_35_14 TaxID=1974634 RepID=A0A2H0N7H7_9BACT|nr:MAG: hypothetical protein COV57_02325 [Candidatus Liptonbacteria bacterium CG11_big_fil_rev_8_21_14_0_20_35_14]
MKENYKIFFYLCLLAFIFGLAVASNILNIFGLVPNLLLVITVSALFFGFNTSKSLLVYLIGFASSAFEPVISFELLALSFVIILIIMSKRYLSLSNLTNSSLIIVIGTVLLYLLINYNFIIQSTYLVGLEIMLNVILFIFTIGLISFLKNV